MGKKFKGDSSDDEDDYDGSSDSGGGSDSDASPVVSSSSSSSSSGVTSETETRTRGGASSRKRKNESTESTILSTAASPPAAAAVGTSSKKGKTIEERYQKKSQLEHILIRPDSYVGSLEIEQQQLWVWDDLRRRMVYRQIDYIPALYKIFDEILVNAADVKAREMHESSGRVKRQKMSTLSITIDEGSSEITIWNDGDGVPVEIHKEHQIFVPELIFGHLLTSDNYDDTELRVTGGRNGYGAKLTNIFSSEFRVECRDSLRKKKFLMTWNNNMAHHSKPKVTEYSGHSDRVSVSFRPDLTRFRISEFGKDHIALFKKRAYDIAGTCGVKVVLNGETLPIKTFKAYVGLYLGMSLPSSQGKTATDGGVSKSMPSLPTLSSTASNQQNALPRSAPAIMPDGLESPFPLHESSTSPLDSSSVYTESPASSESVATEESGSGVKVEEQQQQQQPSHAVMIYEKCGPRWEIVVSESDSGQFQQVSFVNSICTSRGGTHITHVLDPLVTAILKKVNAKNKGGMEIKGPHVKNHLFVFVNCVIVNPSFDSQTKETLTSKPSSFGSKCEVADKTIAALIKSPIIENILFWAQTKQQMEMRKKMKTGGGRASRILGVAKLEDANDAGTKHASECTLILTEGDSAKTSCVAGLSVVGRDKYGVFPLRGKLLNVRDASFKSLTENAEIQNIMKIVGLEIGKKEVDPKSLRYGSLVIMCDQDHDGSHIKGLLINFIQQFWPGLLAKDGFLREFVTPIVKVSRLNRELSFFTLTEYEKWKRSEAALRQKWKIKYYKGLGTSTDKEFKEYFSELDKHLIEFEFTGQKDFELIDMAFNSKRAEDRKLWIQSFQSEVDFVDHTIGRLSYSDFINKELVQFSKYDTERSIPSLLDGWKPGQRKVLFGVLKKNLEKSEMKVAQLASYVAEVSAYHHGEESLAQTIVNMAQNFVGANNLNVLEPKGQFGSRKEGGKDASATRYIFTKLAPVTKAIFNPADDELLTYNREEGRSIEPKFYMPILPMVLVNGAEGIGTGWSSSIPCYNPRDIIANLQRFIAGEPMVPMQPWYRGFCGTIEPQNNGKKGFDSIGIIRKLDEETVRIEELPIKLWTSHFKEILDGFLAASLEDGAHTNGGGAARAKAKPKAKAAASRGAIPSESSNKFSIIDFRDNSSHETVCFTVKLSAKMMKYAEEEGFIKVFKLKKSLPTTNMTLFNPEGKVCRYDSELDIMREFAKIRLEFYHKRKRHIIGKMERELAFASNKLRFVLEIVEEKLVISKKKRVELIDELRQRGYETATQIQERFKSLRNETLENDGVEEDGVVKDADDADESEEEKGGNAQPGIKGLDFEYLLGMALWSLTYERVEQLRKEMNRLEVEVEDFKAKSPEQLWLMDLEKLLDSIEKTEKAWEAERARDIPLKEKAKRSSIGLSTKRQRRVLQRSDDDDEDYVAVKPAQKKRALASSRKGAPVGSSSSTASKVESTLTTTKVTKPVPQSSVELPPLIQAGSLKERLLARQTQLSDLVKSTHVKDAVSAKQDDAMFDDEDTRITLSRSEQHQSSSFATETTKRRPTRQKTVGAKRKLRALLYSSEEEISSNGSSSSGEVIISEGDSSD